MVVGVNEREPYIIGDVARFELVRTLRDLGAGLDDIRRVPAEETGLKPLTQYRSPVATINGTAKPDPDSDRARAAVVREWMGAALRQAP